MSHEDGVIATNDDASNCKRYRVFIFVLIENYDHCFLMFYVVAKVHPSLLPYEDYLLKDSFVYIFNTTPSFLWKLIIEII